MNLVPSALYISVGILAYLLVALAATGLVRKTGGNLSEMAGRTSSSSLLIGGATNVVVLAIVLLLIAYLDRLSFTALGLTLSGHDSFFVLIAAVATPLLAMGFARWRQRGQPPKAANPPSAKARGSGQLIVGALVLLVVAVQEEVLYRGYITLNLAQLSVGWILVVSTGIFVVIHFFTNRVGLYQIVSWTASGLVLAAAYLASGSIWVPILLHLATDLTNVLVFDITGQQTAPGEGTRISGRDRAVFRVVYGVLILLLLTAVYPAIRTPTFFGNRSWASEVGQPSVPVGNLSVTGVQISRAQVQVSGQTTLPQGVCIRTQLAVDDRLAPWWPSDRCANTSAGRWELVVDLGQGDAPAEFDRDRTYAVRALADGEPGVESQPFVFDVAGPPPPTPE
ncbi:MAG: CPBP family intramembrane glutamic endopeptidase [Caldilineaceae bacterium]